MNPLDFQGREWYTSLILEVIDKVEKNGFTRADRKELEGPVELLLDGLAKHYDDALLKEQLAREGFETRLYQKWGSAFDLYEFVVVVNEQTGAVFAAMQDTDLDDDDATTLSALVRLHARACQVAREVGALIWAGYADGAFSRWRSLYELAAVACIIADHGDEMAERFLAHRHIDDYHEMKSYQKYYEDLGFEPVEDETVERLEELHDKLLDEYGDSFGGLYGWASGICDGRVGMKDIVQETGIEEYWAHYKFASDSVHAGSKGTQYRMGLAPDSQDSLLLSGPSNVGFTDPAQFSAIMLSHVTSSLLSLEESLYWDVVSETMNELYGEVAGVFYISAIQPELEEKSLEIAEKFVEKYGDAIMEGKDLDDSVSEEIMNEVFGEDE